MTGFEMWKAVLAFGVGAGLGGVFLGGLWWTVRCVPSARHPAWLAIGSFVARIGAAALVFVWIVRTGHWLDVVSCLAGFGLVRVVWTWWASPNRMGSESTGEAGHREHLA